MSNTEQVQVEAEIKTPYKIAPDRSQFELEYFVSKKGEKLTDREVNLEVEMKTQYDPKAPEHQKAKVGSWKSYHINHIYLVQSWDALQGQTEEIHGVTINGEGVVLWGFVNSKYTSPTRIFDNERYNVNQGLLKLSGNRFISLLERFFKKK